jgi:hypothetical protein
MNLIIGKMNKEYYLNFSALLRSIGVNNML